MSVTIFKTGSLILFLNQFRLRSYLHPVNSRPQRRGLTEYLIFVLLNTASRCLVSKDVWSESKQICQHVLHDQRFAEKARLTLQSVLIRKLIEPLSIALNARKPETQRITRCNFDVDTTCGLCWQIAKAASV